MRLSLLFPLLVSLALLGRVSATAKDQSASLEDLQNVQQTVQALLPKIRPAVVAIQTGDGTASGVIINDEGLILTAAHVAEKPGRELVVVLDDGSRTRGTTLGLDKTTDAALMQLKDRRKKWPNVKVSREVIKALPGIWCLALGHPGGFDPKRGVVLRVGRVIKQTANSLQTDCVLMGGDSGGPLFNLVGEVIGIHSQIWEDRDHNMHVSMAPFFRSWDDMKSNQVIQTWSSGSGGYLGIIIGSAESTLVEVQQIHQNSAAQKAGLQVGDKIESLDQDPVLSVAQFQNAVRLRPAGTEVKLKIRRNTEMREISVMLGSLPKEDAG
jgi:serine protease Do